MKKWFMIFKMLVIPFLYPISNAWAIDKPTIGELHPPVEISIGQEKISLFFLQNNLKLIATDAHVPTAEVFYLSEASHKLSLNYVYKIEGDQIASVFFYDWVSREKEGKSMFVLMKSRLSTKEFEGFTYSTMEFPIVKDGQHMAVKFFPKDLPDSVLGNCTEGRNLINGEAVSCGYKTAIDIKKYLVTQDK